MSPPEDEDPALVRTFEMLVERLSNVERKLDAALECNAVAARHSAVGSIVPGALFGWPGVMVRKCYSGDLDLDDLILVVADFDGNDVIVDSWARGESTPQCSAIVDAVGRSEFERIKAECVRRQYDNDQPTCGELGLTAPPWDAAEDFQRAAERLAFSRKYSGQGGGVKYIDDSEEGVLLRLKDNYSRPISPRGAPRRCYLSEVLAAVQDIYAMTGGGGPDPPPISIYSIPWELEPLVLDKKGRYEPISDRRCRSFLRLTSEEIGRIREYVGRVGVPSAEQHIEWSFVSGGFIETF
jgi:hypothetical protein